MSLFRAPPWPPPTGPSTTLALGPAAWPPRGLQLRQPPQPGGEQHGRHQWRVEHAWAG